MISKYVPACLRVAVLLALVGSACTSGSGGNSPDGEQGVDCDSLKACDDKLHCGGGDQCFKLKSCPGFVCAETKVACGAECGPKKCLVLESQPMLLSCK